LYGAAAMMCTRPCFAKSARSSPEGEALGEEWLCTVPQAVGSMGIMWSLSTADRPEEIVPGNRSTSLTVSPVARSTPANSLGWLEREAPRINSRASLSMREICFIAQHSPTPCSNEFPIRGFIRGENFLPGFLDA